MKFFFSIAAALFLACIMTDALQASVSAEANSYPVTASDYCEFLNQKAGSNSALFYDEKMASDVANACIKRTGEAGSYEYVVIAGRENIAVTFVNKFAKEEYSQWKGKILQNDDEIENLTLLETSLRSNGIGFKEMLSSQPILSLVQYSEEQANRHGSIIAKHPLIRAVGAVLASTLCYRLMVEEGAAPTVANEAEVNNGTQEGTCAEAHAVITMNGMNGSSHVGISDPSRMAELAESSYHRDSADNQLTEGQLGGVGVSRVDDRESPTLSVGLKSDLEASSRAGFSKIERVHFPLVVEMRSEFKKLRDDLKQKVINIRKGPNNDLQKPNKEAAVCREAYPQLRAFTEKLLSTMEDGEIEKNEEAVQLLCDVGIETVESALKSVGSEKVEDNSISSVIQNKAKYTIENLKEIREVLTRDNSNIGRELLETQKRRATRDSMVADRISDSALGDQLSCYLQLNNLTEDSGDSSKEELKTKLAEASRVSKAAIKNGEKHFATYLAVSRSTAVDDPAAAKDQSIIDGLSIAKRALEVSENVITPPTSIEELMNL